MGFMQRASIVLTFSAVVVVIGGCSASAHRQPGAATELLEENSCAVRCPVNSGNAYAGVSGSVQCRDTARPVCQCSDDTKPMGACEPIEQ